MKKLMLILLLLVSVISVTFAMAPLPRGVLDIDGRKDKIKLTLDRGPQNGQAYNPNWAGKGKDFYLHTVSHKLTKDDWEIYTTSFTPGKDGFVTIIFKGVRYIPKGAKKLKAIWNYWDDIKIEGAEVSNAGFKVLDENGLPKDWNMTLINFTSSKGNKYLKVCYSNPVRKTIKVKKGIQVSITARIKIPDAPYAADIFPIGFWAFHYIRDPQRYEKATSDEQYKLIKDCNFNLVIGGPLSQAEKFRLKSISCVLKTKKLKSIWYLKPYSKVLYPKQIREIINAVRSVDKTSPALWGYHLSDEPGKKLYPRLAWLFSIIRSVDPKHKIFVNCLPGTDPEPYIKTVNPDIIGYDKYPIFVNNGERVTVDDPVNGRFDNSSFLVGLSKFRKAALKYHKPFIMTMLSTGHYYDYKSKGKHFHRDYGKITEAKLRWQAYSALAYNVNGIAWFTYFTSGSKTYEPAAIGFDWKPTKTYYWLKKLNREVFNIGKIIKGLKSDAVYETKPVFFWNPESEKYVTFFPADDIIRKVDNALTTVSKFTGAQSNVYLIIVNRDIKNPVKASLVMKWEQIDKMLVYDRKNLKWGEVIWNKGDKKHLEVNLAPGDGKFIKVITVK